MDFIHTSCLPDHCWKLFCHFLHLTGPLCWPSQKLSTICWMLLSFSLFLSFQFCPISVFKAPPWFAPRAVLQPTPWPRWENRSASPPATATPHWGSPRQQQQHQKLYFEHNSTTRSFNSYRNDYWFSVKIKLPLTSSNFNGLNSINCKCFTKQDKTESCWLVSLYMCKTSTLSVGRRHPMEEAKVVHGVW